MNKLPEDSDHIRKLTELNDELENYFRNTVIPQLFVDADYKLRKFTPPAMKQFNLSPSDIGKHVNELTNNIRFPTIMENIKEVIDLKIDLEKEIQTTDGKWFQMNIIPYIIKKENKSNGVILTFVDITERIRTLKEVEDLIADHETFIYSVTHDLKAPVTNIESLINAWNDIEDKNSEESISISKMINTSFGNIKKIITELGDLSKVRYDFTKEAERINIENILEDVKLTLKEEIVKSNAQIHTEFNASEINFIRKNVRSILYNLLNNAIKYKAPGRNPEIYIKTEKQKYYFLLSVKDNGMGIEEDKKSMIFSKYSRIGNTVEGTGIGLYLVSRMVDSSGGKIKVESKMGEGNHIHCIF